jgi:hypothetical protein
MITLDNAQAAIDATTTSQELLELLQQWTTEREWIAPVKPRYTELTQMLELGDPIFAARQQAEINAKAATLVAPDPAPVTKTWPHPKHRK